MFYVPVNSYGHVETASSPNHTFLAGGGVGGGDWQAWLSG